ncbi:hypothetical protein [Kytococcus sp. Marseille-QA3725]
MSATPPPGPNQPDDSSPYPPYGDSPYPPYGDGGAQDQSPYSDAYGQGSQDQPAYSDAYGQQGQPGQEGAADPSWGQGSQPWGQQDQQQGFSEEFGAPQQGYSASAAYGEQPQQSTYPAYGEQSGGQQNPSAYGYAPGGNGPGGKPPKSGGRDWLPIGCLGAGLLAVLVLVAALWFGLGNLGSDDSDNDSSDDTSTSSETDDEPTDGETTEEEPTEDEPTDGETTEEEPTEDEPTDGETTEESTEDDPTDGESTDDETTDGTDPTDGGGGDAGALNGSFGEALEGAGGVEITAGELESFSPSDSAAGFDDFPVNVVQEVTITNNGDSPVDPIKISFTAKVGDEYAHQGFDSKSGVKPPSDPLEPGDSVTYKVAWNTPSKEDLEVKGVSDRGGLDEQEYYWKNG